MSGNIFPVKLASLHNALLATGVLRTLAEETKHYGLAHNDAKVRIVLRSPEVMKAVCKHFSVKENPADRPSLRRDARRCPQQCSPSRTLPATVEGQGH